jgi:hypothetical protein
LEARDPAYNSQLGQIFRDFIETMVLLRLFLATRRARWFLEEVMKTSRIHSLLLSIVVTSLLLTSAVFATPSENPVSAKQQCEQLVEQIRARIAADPSLSPMASEIEYVALDNRIALQGSVPTPGERCKIMVYAQEVAGWQNIADRMHFASR